MLMEMNSSPQPFRHGCQCLKFLVVAVAVPGVTCIAFCCKNIHNNYYNFYSSIQLNSVFHSFIHSFPPLLLIHHHDAVASNASSYSSYFLFFFFVCGRMYKHGI